MIGKIPVPPFPPWIGVVGKLGKPYGSGDQVHVNPTVRITRRARLWLFWHALIRRR